jgi:hypothetical protein
MTRRILELGEATSLLLSEAFKRDLGVDGYVALKVKTLFDRKASYPHILFSCNRVFRPYGMQSNKSSHPT